MQEKKVGKYKDNCIYSIKCKPEWRHWLHINASALEMKGAQAVEEAVKLWAKANNLTPPPERWDK